MPRRKREAMSFADTLAYSRRPCPSASNILTTSGSSSGMPHQMFLPNIQPQSFAPDIQPQMFIPNIQSQMFIPDIQSQTFTRDNQSQMFVSDIQPQMFLTPENHPQMFFTSDVQPQLFVAPDVQPLMDFAPEHHLQQHQQAYQLQEKQEQQYGNHQFQQNQLVQQYSSPQHADPAHINPSLSMSQWTSGSDHHQQEALIELQELLSLETTLSTVPFMTNLQPQHGEFVAALTLESEPSPGWSSGESTIVYSPPLPVSPASPEPSASPAPDDIPWHLWTTLGQKT